MLVFHQWWLLFNNGDKDSYNHPLLCDYMLRFHSFETPSSRRYISHHSSCGTMTYMQLMVSDMFLSHTHRYKLLLFGDEISKMTAAVWLINARFQCFLFSHNQTTFNYLVMPVFRLSHYNIAIIPHPHLSVLQSLFGHLCCCCFFSFLCSSLSSRRAHLEQPLSALHGHIMTLITLLVTGALRNTAELG